MIRYSEGYRRNYDRPEEQRLHQQEKLLFDATELISRAMKAERISKAELAKRIGKTKAYVTQVLRGQQNMTLRTLADLAWALGYAVELSAANSRNGQRVSLDSWVELFPTRLAPCRSPLQVAVMELVPRLERATPYATEKAA